METNYFNELNKIDVSDKTEEKNGLTYLSWAFAWGELKKRHPDATYKIYENRDEINYFTDGRTGWVKTGVTVNGIEHIEYLPIMDYKNKSIPVDNITSFDVNKAIQRSLTKAVARHGIGLYIYAGEDLPEGSDGTNKVVKKENKKQTKKEETVEKPKMENKTHTTEEGFEIDTKTLAELVESTETEEELKTVYQAYKSIILDDQYILDMVTTKRKGFKKVA